MHRFKSPADSPCNKCMESLLIKMEMACYEENRRTCETCKYVTLPSFCAPCSICYHDADRPAYVPYSKEEETGPKEPAMENKEPYERYEANLMDGTVIRFWCNKIVFEDRCVTAYKDGKMTSCIAMTNLNFITCITPERKEDEGNSK